MLRPLGYKWHILDWKSLAIAVVLASAVLTKVVVMH